MSVQLLLMRKIEREKKLALLIAKRYNILRVLYTGHDYVLTDLKNFLENLEEKIIDLGNLSNYVKNLEDKGLVLKEDRKIKISSKAQEILYAIVESARPEEEKLWQPQLEEVKFCIEVLESKNNGNMHEAFLSELRSILNSDYWDKQLDIFLSKILDSPKEYEKEIDILLQARPRNQESIELFFKNNKEKIYDLVESSDRHSTLALSIFVDASDGREVLDRMEEALKGEGAERIIIAAHGCGRKIYEKHNLDFKKFLHKALKHESKKVKNFALSTMKAIQPAQG